LARPLKEGLDYYPQNVGTFNDPKILELIITCGWSGYAVWCYLLDLIYQNGYFYCWSDKKSPKAVSFKMSGGISEGQVREVVKVCCECGLLNAAVLNACDVLTSRGIQRRFCNAASDRKNKEVIDEYWLLEESESAGFIKVALTHENRRETGVNRRETIVNTADNSTEYSRVKESRVKETFNNNNDDSAREKIVTPEWLFSYFFKRSPTDAEVRTCQNYLKKCDHEIVEIAFYRAVMANAMKLSFVRTVLTDFHERGIKTMADVAKDDLKRESQQKQKRM
jgi:hypothetical protein